MSGIDVLRFLSPVRPRMVQVAPRALSVASGLRGGTQRAQDLLAQLKGRPGISKADLEMFAAIPPSDRLSPLQLASRAKAPKLYVQRGAGTHNMGDEEMLQEMATDLVYGPEFANQRAETALQVIMDNEDNLPKWGKDLLSKALSKDPAHWSPELRTEVEELAEDRARANNGWGLHDIYMEDFGDQAYSMAQAGRRPEGMVFEPSWGEYQRQPLSSAYEGRGGPYFETVLRTSPREAQVDRLNLPMTRGSAYDQSDLGGYHFRNPGQLGHFRGAVNNHGTKLVIDEIQSDPLEILGDKHPAMRNIYGKIGNAIVESAAQAGIPDIILPTASAVTQVRDAKQAPFFRKIYDDIMQREVLSPLRDAGANVIGLDGWKANQIDNMYHISLSPDLMDAIRRGEGPLGYRKGGLACLRSPR